MSPSSVTRSPVASATVNEARVVGLCSGPVHAVRHSDSGVTSRSSRDAHAPPTLVHQANELIYGRALSGPVLSAHDLEREQELILASVNDYDEDPA